VFASCFDARLPSRSRLTTDIISDSRQQLAVSVKTPMAGRVEGMIGIAVNGREWTFVINLQNAGPTDTVFAINTEDGAEMVLMARSRRPDRISRPPIAAEPERPDAFQDELRMRAICGNSVDRRQIRTAS
jgi:hypothetical protein